MYCAKFRSLLYSEVAAWEICGCIFVTGCFKHPSCFRRNSLECAQSAAWLFPRTKLGSIELLRTNASWRCWLNHPENTAAYVSQSSAFLQSPMRWSTCNICVLFFPEYIKVACLYIYHAQGLLCFISCSSLSVWIEDAVQLEKQLRERPLPRIDALRWFLKFILVHWVSAAYPVPLRKDRGGFS